MKSVINKTPRPIKVPLPGGKTLHLGLSGRGQVPDGALERPAFRRLIEEGKIEVLDDSDPLVARDKSSMAVKKSTHGHPANKKSSTRGDR